MQKLKTKFDMACIKATNWIAAKKEGSDQLMVMFIIIAVAAGVAGLLYIFCKSTLLPEFQSKVTELLSGDFKALTGKSLSLSGRIRIVWHLGEEGGRATCHLILMENGEIYEEVRQLMSKDLDIIKEVVKITPLSVDEVMQSIIEKFGQNIRFSYASYVRGNKDWKKECFLEITEEAEKFTVGSSFGEAFYALSYPSTLKDGFMESLSHLGCQAFLSLDMNSLTDEEQLDFNRAIEKRYNKRLKFSGEDNYLNVSLALVILCDSDDAREIIEKTVIALANNYEIMLSTIFHEQRTVTESVLSRGLIDSKIMRNVRVEVVESIVGGDKDADAKI